MIDTKKSLKEVLRYEREIYRTLGYKGKIHSFISLCEVGYLYKYIESLRYDEYYTNCKTTINSILGLYWRRKHNKLGIKLGISIPINTFGPGLKIYHSQGIIVHRDARIGRNCSLHGLNCIGNNGKEIVGRNTPTIGENCDIGVGASIIGNVVLGNNIKVAAGSVVCKSYEKDNIVLIGIPASNK